MASSSKACCRTPWTTSGARLEVARVLGVRTVAEFVDSEAVLGFCYRELGF